MEQIFGKNITEVLTTGMYKDDTTMYREYIQNAADSIRKAKQDKIYTKSGEDPEIDIEINVEKRFIRISDNGYGVKESEIQKRLLRVADSEKDEDEDMGYRGIGRLCGLAYCKTLKFITSYPGESVESIMTWDAKTLREIQDDPKIKITPENLFKKITSYSTKSADPEKHYFKVELFDIIEGHDDILNKDIIGDYIAETAPIDFKSSFHQRNKITAFAEKNKLDLPCFNISVNGIPIYKKYTPKLYDGNINALKEYDKISDVAFKTFTAESGEPLAWIWYGISAFEKRIPAVNQMRGIRLRRHNIEMGDAGTLVRFFPEERGNYYFIGELHVVHKDLRPNNQRDYFRDITKANSKKTGTIRGEFEEKIKTFFREELYPLYYKASSYKNAVKTTVELESAKQEYEEKEKRGFINETEKSNLREKIEKLENKKKSSDKEIAKLNKIAEKNEVFSKVIGLIDQKQSTTPKSKKEEKKSESSKPVHDPVKSENVPKTNDSESHLITDSLTKLTKSERELIGKVYAVIQEIMPEDKAIILIEKIQDELNKS